MPFIGAKVICNVDYELGGWTPVQGEVYTIKSLDNHNDYLFEEQPENDDYYFDNDHFKEV